MKIVPLLLSAFVLWSLSAPAVAAADAHDPPAVHARAYVLMDGTTGEILAADNPDTRNYPASTTKLLTALVAVEHGQLTDECTIDKAAVNLPADSSRCGLIVGEKQTLRSLLYGLLLPSGNDCALAIALGETHGHLQQFVDWMNAKARALGLTHSHFTNPHGLHDPQHYTTARDLAVIAKAAFANPTIRTIAGTKEYRMPGHEVTRNHDQLLFSYRGAVAGKTGFTEQAECTLVTSAEQNDRYLIAVVIGEPTMPPLYADMAGLLDFGFAARPVMEAEHAPLPPAPAQESLASPADEDNQTAPVPLVAVTAVVGYMKYLPPWDKAAGLGALSLIFYRADLRRRRSRRRFFGDGR